jgi:Domain of unknown function (DUF4124)
MKLIHVAFGLLAAVAATAGHAADKVYKWKDANGIVHFSDAPPPKGTEFNNVKIVNQSAPITQAQAGGTATAAADAQPSKDSNEARCAAASERVNLLAGGGRVTMEKDGKLVELTDAEKASELNIAKATVASLCGPPPQQ